MPLRNQLHVDKLLSQISVKYRNTMFIADQVFPTLPVKKDSDLFRVYDRDFRLPETLRSNKGLANEHSFDVSNSSYILQQHSLKDYVSDRDAENYDIADLRADTTEELTDKILLRMEKSVADLFTSTSWSQNVSLAAAAQWSLNTTTSNPIIQMDSATTAVLQSAALEANYAVIPHSVLLAAKNHDSIIDRIKYTSADITPNMIAGLFDIPQLLVPKAVIDTSAKGLTPTVSFLWGDNVFVGYKPARPSPLRPSAGYTFKNAIPMTKRWRVEERQSEAIEVNIHYQPKVVASLAGYLLKDALA